MTTTTAPAAHSPQPEWHSGGPGKSSYSDYRWQCACGIRYSTLIEVYGEIGEQHTEHLADA